MKNNKSLFYISSALKSLIPNVLYRAYYSSKLTENDSYIMDRVNYYNKRDDSFNLESPSSNSCDTKEEKPISTHIKYFKKTSSTVYYYDMLEVVRNFNPNYIFRFLYGDVTHVPEIPTFVKSRPVENNTNAVLLKLNKIRHFNFINDPILFENKIDQVVWRGANWVAHRQIVLENFYNNKLCNIAQVAPKNGDPWEGDFMSIEEQLNYKFILCIEGNDVATNLKWAMSSNSVCIMSKPKYETWFMEARLEEGVHYIRVKDDYSDLAQKIEYYIENSHEAKQIVKNANEWTQQFKDKEREHKIQLLVAQKYFKKSNQIKS